MAKHMGAKGRVRTGGRTEIVLKGRQRWCARARNGVWTASRSCDDLIPLTRSRVRRVEGGGSATESEEAWRGNKAGRHFPPRFAPPSGLEREWPEPTCWITLLPSAAQICSA
eukprot:6214687-Pleurochrysis_carterae.AAC.2